MSSVGLLLFVIVPFLLVETLRSSVNERALRRQGAVEPSGDPYALIGIVYVGGFVAMALEGWWRGGAPRAWLLAGLALFALAKLVKLWAVASLGPRWSFRILVLPGAPLVSRGPYRYVRHPNYIAVVGELLGAAAMLGAPWTGLFAVLAFLLLLRRRLAVEERALGLE